MMPFSHLFVAGTLAVAALASPLIITHAVHEKRSEIPAGWEKRGELDRRAILPMKVGLTHSNMDKAWAWLNEVSHPDSSKYGQHWSAKQVAEAFAPSADAVEQVKAWLVSAGISESRIKMSQGLNWLEFNATVTEAESLLKTKYNVYEHVTGQPHVACEEYSIPAHLREHVDIVMPTLHFDAPIKDRDGSRGLEKRQDEDGHKGRWRGWEPPKGGWGMPNGRKPTTNLSTCDEFIVPDCLRALYSFPPNYGYNRANSYGIVEYTPEAYLPSDLDMFFRNFSPAAVGTRPIFDSIDGGVNQQTNQSFEFNGEPDLDLEYAIALVYPQPVTLYQAGDLVEGASFNNFLDAIDGSYCTYDGGDNSTFDAIYPDPLPGGYKGPENCGGFAATKVISTSYSYNEHDLTPSYEIRQCNEYMKLGLQGVSVLYSSGDYGVAGNGGQCIAGPGLNANYTPPGANYGRFNPSFPGTCPYITSVGATQVKNNTNIQQALATGTQPEEACETVIYSGGGFSNVFPLPDYQKAAVTGYLQKYPPPYGADRFNNSGKVRGFPDISANGANYVIAVDNRFALVYGTSASSPVLGSILTLINQQRLNFGKGSIGFINPVIYANPWALNDITQGTNQGCGTPGFSTAPGWDPVTGLGTPNYPRLLGLFLSLP